mgnify:CR=1 FL=1
MPLHQQDRTDLDLMIRTARHYGDDPRCRAALFQSVDAINDRYVHSYDPLLGRAVDQIRMDLTTQRGRSVPALYGEFRRGDAVCRVLLSSKQGKQPDLQDAVLLEIEPVSDHTRRFGRMAGVQRLDDLKMTRWFLDEIRHGRDYGRPW